MKKRLLFIAVCLALFVALTICASAATTNEWGTVETSTTIDLTGMATDTDLRVVLFDGTEYHTYPAQYIVTSATDITLDFSKINSAFGKEYSTANNSVIRIEIPRHVLTIVGGVFNYGKNNNLVEVFFPKDSKVTTLKWGCFEKNKGLQKINLPASLTTLDGQNNFAGCSSLKYVTFDEGYSVSYIPLNCFQSCSSLEYIKFPNCVTEIRGGAFGSCSKLKTIIFGDSLQTMGGPMSDSATGGSVWYLPASFYASNVTATPPSNMFHWAGAQTNGVSGNNNNPKNITFVFTGTKAEAEALQAKFKAADAATGENCVGLSRLYNATLCTEEEYEQLTGKKIGEIATGYYLVYGYNRCKAFYENEHALNGTGSCLDGASCSRCGYSIGKKTEHTIFETLTYKSYTAQGSWCYGCSNEGCVVIDASSKTPAIFVASAANGFSTNGRGGIAFGGFNVNVSALDEFNRVNKDKPLVFGIMLVNPAFVGDTFMKNGEVNAQSAFLKFDLSNTKYTNIGIMMNGFNEEAEKLALVISLYAYTDASSVEYIQSADTACASAKVTKQDATLYTITAESVMNKPYGSIEALPEFKKDEE